MNTSTATVRRTASAATTPQFWEWLWRTAGCSLSACSKWNLRRNDPGQELLLVECQLAERRPPDLSRLRTWLPVPIS
jgi:CelD/BcsL family acetyltransferase involved in cellulose biosynthesis